MAQVGRNTPCPCNSGKKYKHCCGRILTMPGPTDLLRVAAFNLEERLVNAMSRFASERFGPHWYEGVMEYLKLSQPPLQEYAADFVMPWSFYLLPVEGRRITEWYLDDRGARLRDNERIFLEAQIDAWPSLWEASEIRPGEGVGMRDLLTGESQFINDHSSSRILEPYHTLLARVVKLNGIAVFGGCHPRALRPLETQPVIDAARRLHGRRTRPVPPESLRSFERAARLFRLWDDQVHRLDARPSMPILQNTDGEPLLWTTDYFTIARGQWAAVQKAIATMDGVDAVSDVPDEVEFVLSSPGNAMSPAMPNTSIARLEVRPDELIVETNSLARANRVRTLVERTCGAAIRYRIRKHTDLTTLLKEERERGADRTSGRPEDEGPIPPELRAQILQDFKKKHYAGWIDEELPILGGKTPREAMATATGRARVEALLKDLELHEGRLPEAERYEVNDIRRALGLEVILR